MGLDHHLYFAFGSNLDRVQMATRCPDSFPVSRAALSGYRLAFEGVSMAWGGGGVATIEWDPDQCVQGVVYSLSAWDLHSLDGYEGHPRCYRRRLMPVELSDGSVALAWVYVKPVRQPRRPHRSYLGVISDAYHRLGFDLRRLKDAAYAAPLL